MSYRYSFSKKLGCTSLALAVIACAPSALAQRSDENAVTAAEDAFGVSVGRETIGVYSASRVRGFSPVDAGNTRIDGLYFDQVWNISSRIRTSTTIRVGLSSLGYPFLSPTGVVDYSLRKPRARSGTSVYAAVDSYREAALEADADIRVSDTLGVGVGFSAYSLEYENGTDLLQHIFSAAATWSPTDEIEITPFWIRSDVHDDDIGPIYSPAGAYAPPTARRDAKGPTWADYEGTAMNYGAVG